jgi:hypothetical protein
MSQTDITILVLMVIAAVVSAGSFSAIVRYLFEHGLADPNDRKPNILAFYKQFIAHTKKQMGRIGNAFWVHIVFAAVFILVGVGYTIYRWVLPLL